MSYKETINYMYIYNYKTTINVANIVYSDDITKRIYLNRDII